MMTSSNGNVFRVTGPLFGEFTGHRWIPRTKASDAELWYFVWPAPWINGWVNNREAGDLRRQRAHYDVIVMFSPVKTWLIKQCNHYLDYRYVPKVFVALPEYPYKQYASDMLRSYSILDILLSSIIIITQARHWTHINVSSVSCGGVFNMLLVLSITLYFITIYGVVCVQLAHFSKVIERMYL